MSRYDTRMGEGGSNTTLGQTWEISCADTYCDPNNLQVSLC